MVRKSEMHIPNTPPVISGENTKSTFQKQDVTPREVTPTKTNEGSASKGIDMRNISQEEIRALAKVTGDDRVWQYIPFERFEYQGNTLVGIENKDYLGMIERRIEYNRSIGQPTKGYEETLAALKLYQGYVLPKTIDAKA